MADLMTDERLAEIRAEDARYSEHPYGEEILESWRDGLTRHQMSGERAILDRRDLLAEVDRLRAQVAAVKACLPRWESEVDEQTRVKEFGIAEGLRVALQDVRQAFGAGDGYCICDSISQPERDCGVAEHRRAALASGDEVQVKRECRCHIIDSDYRWQCPTHGGPENLARHGG